MTEIYKTIPHIILVNGPPYSGKDTFGRALFDAERLKTDADYEPPFPDVIYAKFSAPVKLAIAGFLGVELDEYFNFPDYPDKDAIIPHLGVSLRQLQIDFSEKYAKPLYGEDIFARLTSNALKEGFSQYRKAGYDYPLCCITDCGFQIEVDYLIETMPEVRFLLVQVLREGRSFDNDSREWVDAPALPNISTTAVHNIGTEEEYQSLCVSKVKEWLEKSQKHT